MERRGFLKLIVGGVAAAAAVRTFPFRVFSIPREIVIPYPAMFGGDPGDWKRMYLGDWEFLENVIYLHPLQLDELIKRHFEIREVETPFPSYGSSYSFAGLSIRANPHCDPKQWPPLVAHMPNLHPQRSTSLRQLLAESSARQRV